MLPNRPILLVEDDKVDILTIERAFQDLKIPNKLEKSGNGQEALDYLINKRNSHPCLILLDLNMPIMNGLEFLNEVKNDELLKLIPIVVLTTSLEDRDKLESFKKGISGYMIKPVDYNQFLELLNIIQKYWSLSELPFA